LISCVPLIEPVTGAGGWIADVFAVVGLALLGALLITFAFEKIAGRRKRDLAGTDLGTTFKALRDQPEDMRRLALFRMLRDREPEAAAKLRLALFDPSEAFDAAQVEAMIRNAGTSHD